MVGEPKAASGDGQGAQKEDENGGGYLQSGRIEKPGPQLEPVMTDAAYLDYLAAERAASKAGLVPFLGEWRQSFDIRPVPIRRQVRRGGHSLRQFMRN